MSEIPYCEKVLEVSGGCDKCSPGCKNCWAIGFVWRMAHNPTLGDKWQGLVEKKNGVLNWTGKIKCFEDALKIPLKRKKPTTYFVDSKADLFHPKVPFEFIDKAFAAMTLCPQHTFLVFTKRADGMLGYFRAALTGQVYCENRMNKSNTKTRIHHEALNIVHKRQQTCKPRYNMWNGIWPLKNVQLILSICTQKEADEKIPVLLQIPAAVRGLSIEPMLGVIDLDKYLWSNKEKAMAISCGMGDAIVQQIHRVIVGGESGKGARPMHPDWPRSIRDQCVAAGVPFYFKQWGEYLHESQGANTDGAINAGGDSKRGWLWPDKTWSIRVGNKKAGCLLDGKEWKQLPE